MSHLFVVPKANEIVARNMNLFLLFIIYLSIYLFIYLSIYLFIYLFTH